MAFPKSMKEEDPVSCPKQRRATVNCNNRRRPWITKRDVRDLLKYLSILAGVLFVIAGTAAILLEAAGKEIAFLQLVGLISVLICLSSMTAQVVIKEGKEEQGKRSKFFIIICLLLLPLTIAAIMALLPLETMKSFLEDNLDDVIF